MLLLMSTPQFWNLRGMRLSPASQNKFGQRMDMDSHTAA